MGAVDQALLGLYRISLAAFPIVFPVIAFVNYELTVQVFHEGLELLSFQSKTWYSVDGGQAEAVLIQPLINGIVQPSVSVILACLIASTLTSLRNRQVSFLFFDTPPFSPYVAPRFPHMSESISFFFVFLTGVHPLLAQQGGVGAPSARRDDRRRLRLARGHPAPPRLHGTRARLLHAPDRRIARGLKPHQQYVSVLSPSPLFPYPKPPPQPPTPSPYPNPLPQAPPQSSPPSPPRSPPTCSPPPISSHWSFRCVTRDDRFPSLGSRSLFFSSTHPLFPICRAPFPPHVRN